MYLKLSENKGLEFSVYFDKWCKWRTHWFSLDITWSRKTDHAGFRFWFSVWNFIIDFSIQDKRHWNYEKNKWFEYGEDMKDSLLLEDDAE